MQMSVFARTALSATFALVLLVPGMARGQEAQEPPPSTAPPAKPAESELNLINLPTTGSLDRHESYFRITHRFTRGLGRGDFGQLLEDLFSLDNGAVIGLEYRFGLTSNLQAGVNRTALGKTIDFFGRYDGWRQGEKLPVSL